MDCLSNLPKSVTSDILSRLPMKDAIRTSLLAKSWICKWTLIRSVWVDDSVIRVIHKARFLDFMLKTLRQLPELERLILSCGKGYDLSRITACMHAIFSHKIKTFEIYMLDNDSNVVLPRNLVDCTSLQGLVLALPCILKAPASSYFPNLKDLELRYVQISNPSTNTVFIVLPILERFEIFSCDWSDVKSFGIHAPKLIDFLSEPEGDPYHEYSITIVQAKLEYFTICGSYVENIKLTASTVAHASLLCNFNYMGDSDALVEDGLHTRNLLRGCSSISDLEIEGFILEAIAKSKGLSLLPLFKLEKLSVTSNIDVEGLLELLHATPNLKILQLCNTNVWRYYNFNVPVPSCVVSTLERVIFDDRGATDPLCMLSRFFVENGFVLKTIFLKI